MTALYLSFIGILLYYTKSKYSTTHLHSSFPAFPTWVGGAILVIAVGLNYRQWGATNGLLISAVMLPLACSIVPLVAHLPRRISTVLIILFHVCFIISLF